MSFQQEKLKKIADAIREKTGEENLIKPSDFAQKISEVYTQGNNDICKALSNFGERKNFQYAFQYTNFENITFSEKIMPTSAGSVFQWYRGGTLPKNIDFSQCVFESDVASESKVPHKMFFESEDLKKIHDVGLPAQYRYPYTFFKCTGLEEIEIIRNYPETIWTQTFLYCFNLKKVRFSNSIAKSIDFRSCPLDIDTLEHIIVEVLEDLSQLSASILILSSKSYKFLKNDTRQFPFYMYDGDRGTLVIATLLEIISYKGWKLTVTG